MQRVEALTRLRGAADRVWHAKINGDAHRPQALRDQIEVLTVTLEAIYRFLSVGLRNGLNTDYDRARHEAKWLVRAARKLVTREPRA